MSFDAWLARRGQSTNTMGPDELRDVHRMYLQEMESRMRSSPPMMIRGEPFGRPGEVYYSNGTNTPMTATPSGCGCRDCVGRREDARRGMADRPDSRSRGEMTAMEAMDRMRRLLADGYPIGTGNRDRDVDPALAKYRNRKLNEYSDVKFAASEDLLPKDMVPAAVMCPAEHIAGRVAAYLK